ncbi:MAG: hypothetical protein ACRC2T_11495, partial [Thermoguttaceae bacterium]
SIPQTAKALRAIGVNNVSPEAEQMISQLEKAPASSTITISSKYPSDTEQTVKIVIGGQVIAQIVEGAMLMQESVMNNQFQAVPFDDDEEDEDSESVKPRARNFDF